MGHSNTKCTWLRSLESLIECDSQQQLLKRLIFIDKQIDSQSQIFRLSEPPYQSLIKGTRSFQHDSPIFNHYLANLKRLALQLSHRNLAQVQFLNIIQQSNMCMEAVKVEHYSIYYGIQLRDVIDNRKRRDSRFTESEILYVAKSLISFGKYIESFGICHGQYQSKNIYISDKGYLKLYLLHIEADNHHSNYYTCGNCSRSYQLRSELPIAPQFLVNVPLCQKNQAQCEKNQFSCQKNNSNLNLFKSDIFSIGMILVEMMMENSLQTYYYTSKNQTKLDAQKLKKDLYHLQHNLIYSTVLIQFVQRLLQSDLYLRSSFYQAQQILENIRQQNVQFACRIDIRRDQSSEDNVFSKKISFKNQQPQSQYILRSIQTTLQQKLMPHPLKSLSKFQPSIDSHSSSIQKSINTSKNRPVGVTLVSDKKSAKIVSANEMKSRKNSFSEIYKHQNLKQTTRCSQINQNTYRLKKRQSIQMKSYNTVVDFDQAYALQKSNENWMTLGSTRITEENNRHFSVLPPKFCKSNPKLKIRHQKQISQYQKQNSEKTGETTQKQGEIKGQNLQIDAITGQNKIPSSPTINCFKLNEFHTFSKQQAIQYIGISLNKQNKKINRQIFIQKENNKLRQNRTVDNNKQMKSIRPKIKILNNHFIHC